MFSKRINVPPHHQAIIYKNNVLLGIYESGTHSFPAYTFGSTNIYHTVVLGTTNQSENIHGQEVLTKDNIALRFSYMTEFKIIDAMKVASSFDFWEVGLDGIVHITYRPLMQQLREHSKITIRENIAKLSAIDINTMRQEITDSIPETLNHIFEEKGIHFKRVSVTDITFPKFIQEKFAYELEAKLKSRSDLENARTQVATARTLKNAAELMKDNPQIKYLLYLETLKEISKKGNNSFTIEGIEGVSSA